MLYKFRKGNKAGMPILIIVAVMTTLVGTGVIYQVVNSIGGQTGQDHDARELSELGSAIENKCTDLTGTSDTTSVTAISVDVDINSGATLSRKDDELQLDYSGEGADSYGLPEDCTVNVNFGQNGNLSTGNHQVEVSGQVQNGDVTITVEEN